jgi:peptidoglycan/LPS O-acetylase OafA/YrhL
LAETAAWREHDRFAMLDALRGVLAVILFVAHTHDFFGAWARPASAITLDTYFVMAGFILAFVYEPRFAAGLTVRAFIAIRIVRFLPIYLIGALLGLGVVFMASPDEALGGLAGLQLLMLPVPGDALYPWNIVAWAVLAELVVSIVYALTRRWLSMRVLAGAVAVMAVVLGAAAYAIGQIGMGAGWNTAAGGVARAMFGFLAGLLLYRMAGAESQSLAHAQAPETRRAMLAFMVLLVPVVMAWTPAASAMRPVIDMAMAVGVNVLLIALAARFQPPVFVERTLAPLGTIAYALLLIHLPLYYLMVKLTYRWPWLYDIAPLSGLALFVVTVAAAFTIDRWVDRPLRRVVLGRIAGGSSRRVIPEARERVVR